MAEQAQTQDQNIRMLFLGATGNGKSTMCNDLLGANHFEARANVGGGGVSQVFSEKQVERNGKKISVIDSPGFGDVTIDMIAAINSLYETVGENDINFVIIVVKATDERFESAARVALIFINSFLKEINPQNFWLAVTWSQIFENEEQKIHFANEKIKGIQNEYNLQIPEENVIYQYKKTTDWIDQFLQRLTPGRAGILQEKQNAVVQFAKQIQSQSAKDKQMESFVTENKVPMQTLIQMLNEFYNIQIQNQQSQIVSVQKDQESESEWHIFWKKVQKGCFSRRMALLGSGGELLLAGKCNIGRALHNPRNNGDRFWGMLDGKLSQESSMLRFTLVSKDTQSSADDFLECTCNHIVFAAPSHGEPLQGRFMAAEDVRVGNLFFKFVQDKQLRVEPVPYVVVQISPVIVQGFFCPLTDSGEILVNGFLASCYVQKKKTMSHEAIHAYMQPLIFYKKAKLGLRQLFKSKDCSPEGDMEEEDQGQHCYIKMLLGTVGRIY